MQVRVELQVGGRALHGHDRAALRELARVPAEYGVYEQARDRAEQRRVVSQPRAQWVRQREHPLPERDRWQHVLRAPRLL